MALKVKNISTGEVVQVKNVNIADDGVLVSDVWAPRKSNKFFEIYPMMVRTDRKRMIEFNGSAVECDVLELASGWEVDTTRKSRKPRTQKVRASKPESKYTKAEIQDIAAMWINRCDGSNAEQLVLEMKQSGVPFEAIELFVSSVKEQPSRKTK